MNPNLVIRSRLHFLGLVLVLVSLGLHPAAVTAQSNPREHLAAILILDDSGSMKSSDPTGLRYTGAQLFVSLLDEGDAVGALRFSTASAQITQGIEIIENPEQHAHLVESLAAVPPDGYTDVKAAFQEARRMQQAFNQDGFQVAVIFLTDGKPEIHEPYPAYEQEALDAARELNVPILSIALTVGGQTPFLNRVASETGGRVIFAKEATDLLDIYLQILGDLKDRTVIGAGSADAPGEVFLPLDPALAPYVDRVSFVVSKPASASASLIAPDGQVVSMNDPGVAFAIQDPRFVIYSLPKPAGGAWQFDMSGSGSVQARAILYSRLRVQMASPQGIFEAGAPVPLALRLVEEQPDQAPVTIIGEASFSAWITRPDGAQDSLDQFYDDGTHGDTLAGDGLYTRLYVNTEQPGTYQVKIQGFKGTVPVAAQTHIQGIAFPMPLLDQPLLLRYDIRTDAIPLQIHLDGAAVNELDRGGFVAVITTPGRAVERLDLENAGSSYSGTYLPSENGSYQVVFEPYEAAYQGLPYLYSLETTFEARLIPLLVIQSVQVGLQALAAGETPSFELIQAQQGISLMVTFSSTSPKAEEVTVRLEDLPGFTLQESGAFSIVANSEANGVTTLALHLIADPTLTPKTYRGRLVFAAPEGVDLTGGDVSFAFDLFEPTLSLSPVITSVVSSDSCLAWAPVRLTLHLNSTSIQNEQIQVRLENLPGAALSQETVTVLPGASQVQFTILPGSQAFAPGNYTGKIVVDGVRPGLKVTGDSSFQIAFQVDPVWVTCRRPMIILGFIVVFGVIMVGALIMRFTPQKPIVTGTLIHWNEATPNQESLEYLTELKKAEVKIGKGPHNDIVIPDDSVEEEHLLIRAERMENNDIQLIIHPIAPIKKGYQERMNEMPLEVNIEYKIGNRKLKYISE